MMIDSVSLKATWSILFKIKAIYCLLFYKFLRTIIIWTKPAATEMRFGFEVRIYVINK